MSSNLVPERGTEVELEVSAYRETLINTEVTGLSWCRRFMMLTSLKSSFLCSSTVIKNYYNKIRTTRLRSTIHKNYKLRNMTYERRTKNAVVWELLKTSTSLLPFLSTPLPILRCSQARLMYCNILKINDSRRFESLFVHRQVVLNHWTFNLLRTWTQLKSSSSTDPTATYIQYSLGNGIHCTAHC